MSAAWWWCMCVCVCVHVWKIRERKKVRVLFKYRRWMLNQSSHRIFAYMHALAGENKMKKMAYICTINNITGNQISRQRTWFLIDPIHHVKAINWREHLCFPATLRPKIMFYHYWIVVFIAVVDVLPWIHLSFWTNNKLLRLQKFDMIENWCIYAC